MIFVYLCIDEYEPADSRRGIGIGMKSVYSIFLTALMVMSVSCGKKNSFYVSGSVAGLGTQNLTAIYMTDEAVVAENISAVDSVFGFTGRSAVPTVVEIYSNSQALLGRFIARDGDKMEVALDPRNPLLTKVTGDKDGERLAAFLRDNVRESGLNDAIDRYVVENKESFVSVALMGYYYDPEGSEARAVELMDMIDNRYDGLLSGRRQMLAAMLAPVQPVEVMTLIAPRDTLVDVSPAKSGLTLYWIDAESHMPDSVAELVDSLMPDKISVNHLRLSPDSTGWLKERVQLTPKVNSYWAPGGAGHAGIMNLGVFRFPCFIVTDSAGNQLLREYDMRAVSRKLRAMLNN